MTKHSYSSTNDYQICKARYFRKHVARDVPFESTPQTEYGKKVHDAFKDMLNAGRVFPDDLKHLEPLALTVLDVATQTGLKLLVEQRLGIRADGSACAFYDDDCAWGGLLDCVLMNDVTALLFDWKTGKEREDPFELRIHAVLLKVAYPNLEVFKGRYVWIKHNKIGELHNLTDVSRTWAEMQSISSMIEQNKKMRHWPEQEGPLCKGYCPVADCRFFRPAANAAGK